MRWQSLGGINTSVVNIPFNAANFNASGLGTWTVVAANITTFQSIRQDRLLHIDFFANAGTIAGNPAFLLLTIPFTDPDTTTCFCVIDPSGNPSGAMGILLGGTNVIKLQPLAGNWGNGVTPLSFEITISV